MGTFQVYWCAAPDVHGRLTVSEDVLSAGTLPAWPRVGVGGQRGNEGRLPDLWDSRSRK